MKHPHEEMETVEPTVRAILDDIVIREDGLAYINNYASWVKTLRNLKAKENPRLFVQLAVVARQFFDADCKSLSVSLATLARIGLHRLSKSDAPQP